MSTGQELNQFREMGIDALQYFHNECTINFPDAYKISFAELQRILISRPNQKNFLVQFGGAISTSGMADYKVASAMEELSEKGKGFIPSSNSAFIQALSDEATNVHFVEALGDTAIETVKDVLNGTAKIGDTILNVGDTLLGMSKWLIPLGVLAYVAIIMNREYKK